MYKVRLISIDYDIIIGEYFSLQLYVLNRVSMVEHVFNQMCVSVHQSGQEVGVKQVRLYLCIVLSYYSSTEQESTLW